jgi:hypothetical protein
MLNKGEAYGEPKASRHLVHGDKRGRLHEFPEARPLIATSPAMTIMPRDGEDMVLAKRVCDSGDEREDHVTTLAWSL